MKGSLSQRITLKTPGNRAVTYNLRETAEGGGILEADRRLPLTVRRQKTETDDEIRIVLTLTAEDLLYYNVEQSFHTGLAHENCLFYMPGFWYRKNLRSPESAPSFHTGDSWPGARRPSEHAPHGYLRRTIGQLLHGAPHRHARLRGARLPQLRRGDPLGQNVAGASRDSAMRTHTPRWSSASPTAKPRNPTSAN